MNGQEFSSLLAAANAAANAAINDGRRTTHREAELNSARIEVVADKLAICSQSLSQPDDARLFFQLCLSLARGIDYGVANNEIPEKASKLPPILKHVCRRKHEFVLQAAIMVLMISVKNACKMGWFSTKDTEDLLTLANEVASYFSTMGELNREASIIPTVSTIMTRFYPRYKLGQVIASLEVKPGYGTYLLDFHISKNVPYSPGEKIRLFVAMKDNIYTSSCIISPQKVNILLNGRPVERRTNIFMDPGPQFPSVVNPLLKYGTNLLQAVGQFSGHYIILIAFMSIDPSSSLPVPEDYVQPDTTMLSSESDSEIIEGPSRISLNCPITYRRIGTPVKGHLCKHYQCFDLNNYVELNSKRPSWRCPHCNQSVCFIDLRVDQRMAKILQEVGENVSEVTISADGSWTTASETNHKSHDKASADQQEQCECPDSSGADACKVYDLTEEDDEMEIVEIPEPVDTKPVIQHNVQKQQAPMTSTPLPAPRSSNETQFSSGLVANALSGASLANSGSVHSNIRSVASQVGGGISRFSTNGISPVLTDSVSPSFNRVPQSHPGPPISNSMPLGLVSQLSDILYPQQSIPRNVSRDPSAIQALPVQMPMPNQQQPRPTMNMPAPNRSAVPFQVPLATPPHVRSVPGNNNDRQWRSVANPANVSNMPPASLLNRPLANSANASNMPSTSLLNRPLANQANASNMPSTSLQNRSAPRVAGPSTPSQNANIRMPQMPQILSQPPHLRSSQVPHNHVQQGGSHGGVGNSPSTVERIQLMSQRQSTPQMRPPLQNTPPPTQGVTPPQATQTQTQALRMTSSPAPLNKGATQTQTQSVRMTPSPAVLNSGATPPQIQAVRMASSSPAMVPLNTTGATPPQAVTRTENLIDLQSEQNWRPAGRMRGSLTGQAYSAALSQFLGSAATQASQAPIPGQSMPATPLSPRFQALASRLQPRIPQVVNRTTDGSTPTAAPGSQPEGQQGGN